MERGKFLYGEMRLSAGIALDIARGLRAGGFSQERRKAIAQSSEHVNKIAAGDTAVYGINTGFGPLCTVAISKENTLILQEKILKSHAVGVGAPISEELSQLMMILKVHALAQGYSGIRQETLDRISWMVETKISPWVPCQGSVGASGDLAPLAHLFLPLIGLGKVYYKGKLYESGQILKKFELTPLALGPKEGLALINGTQFIAAHAIKVVENMHNCLAHADVIGAMMLEGLQGSAQPFLAQLHDLRPFKGSLHVAERISFFLRNSEILASHVDCERVQDPYSLRCMPQVHGASRNAWLHLKELVEIELNAVTDNPVILSDSLSVSGGNFHGQPLALPLDYVCLAAAELGNISDRRSYLSLTEICKKVPKLLMEETGLNSGFMIHQYTSAALVSENKSLCFPASADSIPTSLGQEDHVSMGSISGRKALKVLENLEKILAIELLLATQALDFQRPLKSGIVLEKVYELVRTKILHATEDRIYTEDIASALQLIQEKQITKITHEYRREISKEPYELFEVY